MTSPMSLRGKILLTGSRGQVGWELARSLSTLGEVVALDSSQLDLTDADAIRRVVAAGSDADVSVCVCGVWVCECGLHACGGVV